MTCVAKPGPSEFRIIIFFKSKLGLLQCPCLRLRAAAGILGLGSHLPPPLGFSDSARARGCHTQRPPPQARRSASAPVAGIGDPGSSSPLLHALRAPAASHLLHATLTFILAQAPASSSARLSHPLVSPYTPSADHCSHDLSR